MDFYILFISFSYSFLNLFKESFSIKNDNVPTYIVAILIYIVAIIPENLTQIRFFETVIYKYSSLGIVFLISMTILFLGYLKRKKESRRKEQILV